MRPSFHPRLINDPFLDPGLFVPFRFEKRALLFDLGELSPLTSRDLLKTTHVFVTHTHMDHFIGFDHLLRIFLGRDKDLYLYGPPSFFKHVEGKLAGYTWNLVNEYQNNFTLNVTEVHHHQIITRAYRCRDQFKPFKDDKIEPYSNILLQEPSFHIEAVLLDHRVPSLGFSLVEHYYVNIMKEGLKDLGLGVGPWLNHLKKAIYEEANRDADFIVNWKDNGEIIREKRFTLGDLVDKVARISSGQKITYIADAIGSPENKEKIINLSRKSDHLYIEATFLDRDKKTAQKKYHLTAKEAGEIAKEAHVKRLILFHFSPRYAHMANEIRKEAMEAYFAKE